MDTPLRAVPTPRRERAFSMVEVIIAMLVLAIVFAAASALFGSSRHATSQARVRDEQTAVANEALAKLQSDASWSVWCRENDPYRPADPHCDLNRWIASPGQEHLRTLGVIRDSRGVVLRFGVAATATGIDLTADLTGRQDRDGVVPDVYRMRVTIAPERALQERYPSLQPTTIQQEVNPQIRVETGRVTVSVCLVQNQVDERMPAGECTATPRAAELLPPAALNTRSATTIRNTCRGNDRNTGSDERDCVAYKCAERSIASPNPGLTLPCASHGGWAPRIFQRPFADDFTEMRIRPGTGSVALRHRNGTVERRRLVNGTAQFTGLDDGLYSVSYDAPPGYRPWRGKSVPNEGVVTVEAGLNSRAVLLYRPSGSATVRVRVHSVDNTGPPWMQRIINGYVGMDRDGSLVQGGREELHLVPAPVGRLKASERPRTFVRRSLGTDEFVWQDVEPGLYSFQMSDPTFSTFKSITRTAGFFYVFPDGRVYYGESTSPPEYINGLCAQDIRQDWVEDGPVTNPVTGQVWRPQPCFTPDGPPGPGGTSGGGST